MPFKSMSVMDVHKEDAKSSARSNGSGEEKQEGANLMSTSMNPFKPSGVSLGK